ncbi:hybrid sensor histidine kinase/response regulator transcription factor [Pedobacter metabolipauper]|uniref:histidine kinase n=1 Tax=Pedobacter metabolipauper TaxID=425513 RepID=A0A4R6SWT3_9SPHI|nr:two-component regulator propeller domain-containing protein [Pedobacter metabolipauper]TDQ09891.1 signal transduction histidine kinase [Pedobacter metabolipauper]
MKDFVKFYFITISLFLYSGLAAQPVNPKQFYFQQLDNRNGLSNSAVNVVFQDRDQLLWIGTWDGLNMYDGTDFRVFNYNSENSTGSIGNNVVQDIKEDGKGNIWISTIGGITRFEKSSGKFYRYFYNRTTKRSIAEKEYQLVISDKGTVYCSSKTYGLNQYDPTLNEFKPAKFQPQKDILKIEAGKNGYIWILQTDGILIACKETTPGPLSASSEQQAPASKKQIPALKQVKRLLHNKGISNLYLAGSGVFIADKQNEIYHVEADFSMKAAGLLNTAGKNIHPDIKTITAYQNGYIIAWDSQGIAVFDQNFKPSAILRQEVKQLAATKVISLTAGKDGVLWMGTDGNGLIKIYPKVNHFGLVNKDNLAELNKPVRAFEEVEGNLWIGTKGKGLLILKDFKTLPAQYQREVLNTSNGLENNAVYAIKKGLEPYIYIGTDAKGLGIYDLKGKRSIPWISVNGTSGLPAFGSVYAIHQDRDSSLWLGTSGSGLIHLKLKAAANGKISVQQFKQYLSGNERGPANDIIYALSNSGDNRLWIACRYGGLSVLDKKTGKFKTFRASGYTNGLSNNDVLSLYHDNRKQLWIGTSYGLNKLSEEESYKEQPAFEKFSMNDGLPNNTIHAIAGTNNGSIWVSTNKGIARLDPERKTIASFRESDGLQSNEFSDGAVWKSADGVIYFGGIYGFSYFMPNRIMGNKIQPNLLVSGIQLGGKNLDENRIQVLKIDNAAVPEYTLERKSNFFQLSLKPMSFLNEAKNEFAYKLEGLDKGWNYSGPIGNIIYNNIPPGNYTMQVKWSNGEGMWTEGTHVFKLHIEQYFWLTYPALLLYFILIVISVYAFYTYRKNKLQMKYKLQMEHLLRQKDEQEHQKRLNFFTNIAHEIQTPLTLIMGSVEHFLQNKKSELLKNKESNYFISIVHQHTARLTYLVQQLLEFRKAEAGFLKKNTDYVDISKMLDSLSELFVPGSEKNNQQFTRQIEPGMAGFIDKDKFEKILYNLLSNAFKHSGKNENIRFNAEMQPGNRLQVEVSNSGCRLDQQDLKQIFNKFYVSNEQSGEKFSTGIGLAFTNELVILMGASIAVTLQNGWIRFTVTIPLQAAATAGQEVKVITSAPSSLYESLVKIHEQPELPSAEEENKNTLIDELQQKNRQSILVVEDEPELRFLIRNVLKEQYVVYEAGNGTEALAFLNKTIPNLIISDVMMPDMNGLELCRKVKQTPATAQIPFVILSARGTEENKAEGYEVGADAYIPKPFQINYLHVRIRKLLDYQSRMQDLIKDQHITTQFMDADIADTDKKFLEALLRAIEENLNEPELNAAVLEEALSISKMQLYRKLKSLAGMTPAEFIKRIRLKHAADMLIASQYTVSEIFYRTGFNNKSYFFREFKKIYHCAPNEYRQQQYEENTPIL